MATKKLQAIRGMKDVYGDEARTHAHVVQVAQRIAQGCGFQPFSTPIVEPTEVFKRAVGESSDIVNKEMYSFADRNDESLTLRPEFTAGIARAFISNGLQQQLPLKLFSHGPLFRYERPQKGRQRQFHQCNFEWLGEANPHADVEMIMMAMQMIGALGLSQKVRLEYNTLGDAPTRVAYRAALVEYFSAHEEALSEESKPA